MAKYATKHPEEFS